MYDQLIEKVHVELGEALKKVEVEFKRWHFKQVTNSFSALDVAYQWITPNKEIEDDATIEGATKQVEKEDKLIEADEKGKYIHVDAIIVDIFDEDETTPLS